MTLLHELLEGHTNPLHQIRTRIWEENKGMRGGRNDYSSRAGRPVTKLIRSANETPWTKRWIVTERFVR